MDMFLYCSKFMDSRRGIDEKSDDSVERRPLSDEVQRSLAAEAALIDAEGPLGPYDTTYSVPHQHDTDRVVVFDLLTVTIDDIITQCGYPESVRAELIKTHRRIAADMLRYYKGPINGNVPLLEETAQVGIA